jgi:hypothetical protein
MLACADARLSRAAWSSGSIVVIRFSVEIAFS